MTLGRYKIMSEFRDEDKWGWFTKEQLFVFTVAVSFSMFLIKFFSTYGLSVIGIILSVALVSLTTVIELLSMPAKRYIYGGGTRLSVLLFRILRRKCFRKYKHIACKYMPDQEDEEA